MEYLYSASGSNVQAAVREFRIAKSTVVKKGQIVTTDSSNCIKVGTSPIVGVAAEDHSGTADISNPRANGEKIKVICAPDAVYKVYGTCIKFSHDDCTATSYVTSDGSAGSGNNIFKNCLLVLVKKAEGSQNTDPVGTVLYISGNSVDTDTGEMSFAVSGGAGIPDDDDEYALIAGVGCLSVSTYNNDANLKVGNGTDFACIGYETSFANDKGLPYSHIVITSSIFSKQSEN